GRRRGHRRLRRRRGRFTKDLRVRLFIRHTSDTGQTVRRDGNGSPPEAGLRGPRAGRAPTRGLPGRGRQRTTALPPGGPVLVLGVREGDLPPLRPPVVAPPERGVH